MPRSPRTRISGLTVVVDPDGLLDIPASLGSIHIARDWLALREAYELHGRRRDAGEPRLVLHVTDPATRTQDDLPWDIDRAARTVVARFPGDRRLAGVWRALDPSGRSRLSSLLARRRSPSSSELLAAVWGVVLPAPSPELEFDAVARLRASATLPHDLWPEVAALVGNRLSKALAEGGDSIQAVQDAWEAWLRDGAATADAPLLGACGPAIVGLLTAGILRPAPGPASGLPAWTAIGRAAAPPTTQLAALLEREPPMPAAPTIDDWAQVAAWWGAVRAAIATAAPAGADLASAAWSRWDAIDTAFSPWIQQMLGLLQTSSRETPSTVERIAPFLARRKRARGRPVCLVVMDGMGFTQWSLIRDHLGLRVEETVGVAAVAPTLTPYSRQAIFAGALPYRFADSLANNSKERERWVEFWKGEGVDAAAVRYLSTSGGTGSEIPPLHAAQAVGLAVLAVDDLLHGAKLVGDAEVAGSLRVWLDHGYLRSAIAAAVAAGFDVWMTADHGNLEARAVEYLPQEGLAVDRTGERVRIYPSAVLREASRADGIVWQPPGLPADGCFPLFARGRRAFVRLRGPVVVHGGLSLDEVVVPSYGSRCEPQPPRQPADPPRLDGRRPRHRRIRLRRRRGSEPPRDPSPRR